MNKQPAITEQTKKNLMESFWSFYSHKKIEQITVKEISEKAGYNRGTFYEYFVDVYDVLEQIENALIPGVDELPPIENPASDIGIIQLDMFMKLYEKNNSYYAVLLGENGDPAFASKLKKAVKPIIRESFKLNDISSIETDYILEYILSAKIGIMGYWFNENKSLPAERLISLIYDLMDGTIMSKMRLVHNP